MRIKVLGARQGESTHCHCACLIIDGQIALDAGALSSSLSLEEQAGIQAVLISHRHFDHIKDLATFGFNRMGRGQAAIYCTREVKAALEATVFNEMIWLNFFALPTLANPTFLYRQVEEEQTFAINGYDIQPVAVPHSVPTVGYVIRGSGGTVLYGGDSGMGASETWIRCHPDLLLAEVTFPNAAANSAARFGHLCPRFLKKELQAVRDELGRLPRVAVLHVNPFHTEEIAEEIAGVARELAADLWMPDEGATIEL